MANAKDNTKEKKAKDEEIKHKVIVNDKDDVARMDEELNDRINRLYGLSNGPEVAKKEYDPKELEEARKKIVFLLMGVVVVGFIIIVMMINPFKSIGNEEKTTTDNEEKEEQKEETEEEINEEIPIGAIELSNSTVEYLNGSVTFNASNFAVIDLFRLYNTNTLESNNIPNDIKLFLLKRNESFVTLLEESNIEEYIQSCDTNGVVIDKSKMDIVLSKTLGPNTTIEYKDIDYSYFSTSSNEKKLTLTYSNDQYVVKCNDYQINNDFSKFIQQKLIKAEKTETAIEIYQKVVFINQTGVYKDTNFTNLITNDKDATIDEYIDKGVTYKYTFIENEEDYYLSKIELQGETNS